MFYSICFSIHIMKIFQIVTRLDSALISLSAHMAVLASILMSVEHTFAWTSISTLFYSLTVVTPPFLPGLA